jgi:competence protein ComEA
VRQNPHSANPGTKLVACLIATLALIGSACGTLPRRIASEPQAKLEVTNTENDLRININTASAQDLEKLPGIGNAIAERILAHRAQHGSFRRPEHLMMVRGISDGKFRKIRTMIVVE